MSLQEVKKEDKWKDLFLEKADINDILDRFDSTSSSFLEFVIREDRTSILVCNKNNELFDYFVNNRERDNAITMLREGLVDVKNEYDFVKGYDGYENLRHIYDVMVWGDTAVIDLLIEKGANIKMTNKYGATVLGMACGKGNLEVVKRLLRYGVDPNTRNTDNKNTALHIAIKKKHEDIACFLIENGADHNIRNNKGDTPLHINSHLDSVRVGKLLVSKGADIHAVDGRGRTPLHSAALCYKSSPLEQSRNIGFAKWLLLCGADVNSTDENRETPLFLATRKLKIDFVKMLLGSGADPNIANEKGNVPLSNVLGNCMYIGSSHDNLKIPLAKELIRGGARIDIHNKKGYTPIHFASINYGTYLPSLLVECGSKSIFCK